MVNALTDDTVPIPQVTEEWPGWTSRTIHRYESAVGYGYAAQEKSLRTFRPLGRYESEAEAKAAVQQALTELAADS